MSVSPVCSCLSCPTHAAVAGRPAACAFYPSSSLTDAQWKLLEPLLPPPGNTAGRGGRPEKTVYGLFRRWAAAGAWVVIHDALRDRVRVTAGRHPLPTAAVIDSASIRGADTVPARSRGY